MTEEPKTIEPEQFKFLLNGKNNKPQHHIKYDYYKQDSFEVGLNEFISYAEVKNDLKFYGENYNKYYKTWKQCTISEKKSIIQQINDSFDLSDQEERLSQVKCLAYISLGCFDEYLYNSTSIHLSNIKENNELLFELDVISVLKQSLNHGSHQLEMLSKTCQTEIVELYCKEIDIYLTILYLMVESNKNNQLEEYRLIEFLFDLVVRLKEHFTKTFPLKKLMMCIHKVLSNTLGELNQDYEKLKKDTRLACDLPICDDKTITVKCTPEDLYTFYQQACERYPTFSPIKPSKIVSDPLTISASTKLLKAMGLFNASKNTDLPYQTLFPSKTQQNTQLQQQQQQQNKKSLTIEPTNVLPFSENSSIEPYSLTEATKVWLNHLYISVADYQIIYEREKAVHRWQRHSENNTKSMDDWQELLYDKLNTSQQKLMNRIEHLYSSIIPHFQNIVVVILKLLLSTVSINKDKEAEIVEDINITRNRESISKAVSGILLLLLKWFKQSHVLKFEHLSQVLVDSGCMLLILKLLGLQEVALLASKKTDDDSQSFFGYLKKDSSMSNGVSTFVGEEEEETELYTNERNLYWTINLLRILQMLTKRKTHRIVLLVQYKSSAILKRLLKVGHPTVDYYVLKNLKNQVPFMGRKWRSSNMKTISAIYSNIMTSLNDDWLSCPEGSVDMEDGTTKEIDLRMLARLYNGQRYLPNILPKMDEIVGEDSTVFFVNSFPPEMKSQLPDYNLHSPVVVDDVELDIDFKKDYRSWLETNVYATTDEEDEDEEDEEEADQTSNSDNNWHIGTPLPDALPVAITAEDLTREINKLYLEELEREFAIKQQKQLELEKSADGWDQPAVTSSNSWGAVDSNNGFMLDEEDVDEEEPGFDPLQGINWENLTEEELKKRLTVVEEKTVQRWMNVDMNDPSYLKVLNTFEGEIPEDDDGWPI